jgi:hypothetical protein
VDALGGGSSAWHRASFSLTRVSGSRVGGVGLHALSGGNDVRGIAGRAVESETARFKNIAQIVVPTLTG